MRNHERLNGAAFFGSFETVKRFRMTAGRYRDTAFAVPYVSARTRTHRVRGEVYLVDDSLLSYVDRFEGHPGFYRREMVEVVDSGGWTLRAWIYFNEHDIDGDVVRGGDFARFVERKRLYNW